MLRTLILSLFIIVLLTSLSPLSDWTSGSTLAHWNKRLAHMYSGRDRAHYGHHHSRAWWRRRARQRRVRKLAALQRRRLAAAHSEVLAAAGSNSPSTSGAHRAADGLLGDRRGLSNFVLPARWTHQPATRSGEMNFHVRGRRAARRHGRANTGLSFQRIIK